MNVYIINIERCQHANILERENGKVEAHTLIPILSMSEFICLFKFLLYHHAYIYYLFQLQQVAHICLTGSNYGWLQSLMFKQTS